MGGDGVDDEEEGEVVSNCLRSEGKVRFVVSKLWCPYEVVGASLTCSFCSLRFAAFLAASFRLASDLCSGVIFIRCSRFRWASSS